MKLLERFIKSIKKIIYNVKEFIIDLYNPRRDFNSLTEEQQKAYIEKHRLTLYYLYSDGLYENYMNGDIVYEQYVEELYNEKEFLKFCYIYLDDESQIKE